MEEILIPFIFFASIFGILYIFFTTRHKERIALIEKGLNAKLFDRTYVNNGSQLKFGIVLVGVGIGIVLGYVFSASGIIPEKVAFPAMIFLMAGVGLIVSHLISAKKDSKDDQ